LEISAEKLFFYEKLIVSLSLFQDLKRASEQRNIDLGSRYGDLRLNARVVDPRGQPLNVFSDSEENGNLTFRCHVCAVEVQGKKNIDSHIEGRKHAQNLESFTRMGELQGKLGKLLA
jgi:hypothetical protein